jgi:hypothetical protein
MCWLGLLFVLVVAGVVDAYQTAEVVASDVHSSINPC